MLWIAGGIFLIALSLVLSFFVSFPFSMVNLIFASIILILLWSNSGGVVWLTCALHFCLELFSVFPFGVILISSTMSILITYWLYQNFFTNRSIYSTIFLTIISLSLYRIFSFAIVSFSSLVDDTFSFVLSTTLVRMIMWEIVLTTILSVILYTVVTFFSRRMNPRIIRPHSSS